jgi:hypothetical protein
VWTKEKLERLIADQVEESLTLEYKSAASLVKGNDRATAEITKDVSAFANSSGGVLIYGIAEDRGRRYLPGLIDPVHRTDISKEWLEQIIQGIQPRIGGLAIHPVTVDEARQQLCYVVEIPQSHTAHQARDHKYYKRHNFNVLAMEDYEVRDVMRRKTHPRISASIFVNTRGGFVLVKFENTGEVMAHHVMAEVHLPVDMNGLVPVEDATQETTPDGLFYSLFRMKPGLGSGPIFPGSYLILKRRIIPNVRMIADSNDQPVRSTQQVRVSVFADESPQVTAQLEIAPVLADWTLIQNP